MPALVQTDVYDPAMPDEESNPLGFLTLDDVAGELATSHAQVYALVRRGELRSLKMGGRGQWRVRRPDLEDYIARLYEETDRFVAQNPFVESRSQKERNLNEE